MIYEYQCQRCDRVWELFRPMSRRDHRTACTCGGAGKPILSSVPSWFNRTHPDVKQPMDELVAGVPASNFTEV